MNCKMHDRYLMKYLEKTLSDEELNTFNSHLETCQYCKTELSQMERVFELINQNDFLEPPEDFELSVMSKIEKLEARNTADNKNIKEANIAFLYLGGTLALTFTFLFVFVLLKVINSSIFTRVQDAVSNLMIVVYNILEIPGSYIVDFIEIILKSSDSILQTYYYISLTCFIISVLILFSYKILSMLHLPVFVGGNIEDNE